MLNNQESLKYEKRLDYLISKSTSIISNYLKPTSLSEIIHTIKTGKDIKDIVENVRSCQDPTRKQELKKELPYFTTGIFKENIRNNSSFESTELMLFDYDHLGVKLSEFKEQLKNDPTVFIVFTSPSGDGLKVLYKLDKRLSGTDKYKTVYTYYLDSFYKKYGYESDRTIDPARACFLSYDPDIYVNEKAQSISTDVALVITKTVKKANNKLEELLEKGATPGNRTGFATQIIGHYINRGYDRTTSISSLKTWNQKNNPPLPDDKIEKTVNDMFDRYEKLVSKLPIKLIVKDHSYHKMTTNAQNMLTTFIIEPQELLEFEDGDCMRVSVETNNGQIYEDIFIENTDWHSKSKLLKAIGHSDCIIVGSDNDIQGLCGYVTAAVPVRKKGTKVIGLLKDEHTWVTEGINITKGEISYEPKIVSYDRGKTSFYKGISYQDINDSDYTKLLTAFYSNITTINEENIVIPWLGWTLATPVKPILLDYIGGFPLAFVHGPQGGGKTTTAKLFKRLCGYKDSKPHSCKEKPFPMLKILSSTNAIPVFLDEFKAKLITEDQMNNVIAYMNKAYSGEVESKGQADQTTKDYDIVAPMCVMGEWNISVPSIHERVLIVRFKNSVKENKAMQTAFDSINKLQVEAFMPRYIQFCLQQDIPMMFDEAKKTVENHFVNKMIAPRIVNNLSVMVLGIELFRRFGEDNAVTVPAINIAGVLDHQLKEITGNDSGFVQSAVDQFINELSVIAMKEKPVIETSGSTMFPNVKDPNGYDCIIRKDHDYKLIKIQGDGLEILAINFNKIFPDFKKYAMQTGYEGDLLDKESYNQLFDECPYIYKKDYPTKFNGKTVRSLCIDINKAKDAGINLEGFGIE